MDLKRLLLSLSLLLVIMALFMLIILGTLHTHHTVPVSTCTTGSLTSFQNPTTTATESTTSIGQSSAGVETTAGPTAAPIQTTTPSFSGKTAVAPRPPKPATYASLNQYSVVEKNSTCLLANMTVAFVKQPNNFTTNVTDNAKVAKDRSSCGKLTVTFGNNSFSLVFQKDSKSSSYHLDEIVAIINKERANATGLKVGHTGIITSYVSVSGFNVTLNNNFTFVGTNIQFQPFGVEKDKFATAQVSVPDFGNHLIIGFAIGCAIGCVVAGMITRRHIKIRYVDGMMWRRRRLA